MNNNKVSKINTSRLDLTDAERQAGLLSGVVIEEQVEFVCRAIHTEMGESK